MVAGEYSGCSLVNRNVMMVYHVYPAEQYTSALESHSCFQLSRLIYQTSWHQSR